VSFTTGTGWCYGIHQGAGGCDCAVADSCSIKVVSSADFPGVEVESADFTGSATETGYQIDPRRGQVVDAANAPVQGAVLFTGTLSRQMRADVNSMGRVRLCSPDGALGGYPSC
ncbi:MAG TPA: hypothetical protein VN324_14405, partial [Quisquiliibacterium sp.]|nr:hypothetical protein [Quisquiliibacterium sp.]